MEKNKTSCFPSYLAYKTKNNKQIKNQIHRQENDGYQKGKGFKESKT